MANERTSFGKYQVVARLGRGGMGHVYLAVNPGPAGVQKLVVIKQLREDLAASVTARAMFLDEARIATRLNHPNIVQTNDVVDEADDLYLVMEFLDGQPVARLLDAEHEKHFTLGMRLRILADALSALHYAHELTDYDGTPLDVVHRDVSPHNIVVTYDGQVKLVDFGIAKAAGATTVTESGVFKGKVRYASPEQALCLAVDRRADVFAVGTVLAEMLGAKRMWGDMSDASVLIGLASGQIPNVRDLAPHAPPALVDICMKALAHEPSKRYATALEMRAAIVEYMKGTDDGAGLGDAVTRSFLKERASMRVAIENQIRTVRDTSLSGTITSRPIPMIAPESMRTLGSAGALVSAPPSSAQAESTVPPVRRGRWVIAGVVAATALLAFGIASRAGSKPAPAVEVAAPKPMQSIHLRVRAAPATARIFLDDRPLDSNPFDGEFPRDDAATHTLSIRADGYRPRTVESIFGHDVSVDLALEPLPQQAPPPRPLVNVPAAPARPVQRPSGARPPAAAAPTTNLITKTPADQRTIDEDDPYKH